MTEYERRGQMLAEAWFHLYRARVALEAAHEHPLADAEIRLLAKVAKVCKERGIEMAVPDDLRKVAP